MLPCWPATLQCNMAVACHHDRGRRQANTVQRRRNFEDDPRRIDVSQLKPGPHTAVFIPAAMAGVALEVLLKLQETFVERAPSLINRTRLE
ncbi:hypothetical protein BN77_2869 [Rhizobium mesoamericanum STM3625]|uniref:Uncharacterized protein n=1 Tax=Rhizobium mesoamericanum STM3625 TaxID=1211777 RepID=K0Q041_9HYPH|nr:hypothetical protein BN77_2869 [Rhizobium mesoamericanum STM3625]